MKIEIGTRELDLPGRYIAADLRSSNDIAGDAEALRRRMAEDGYLLIRALHDPDQVLGARRSLLEMAAQTGELDSAAPLMDAVISSQPKRTGVRTPYTSNTTFRALVEAPRIMGFFDHFLGEKSTTFDYKWLRFVGTGETTPMHFDTVYMNRGSQRLYTVWTPLGDVDFAHGPLALLLGSHNLPSYQKVRDTYGRMDVDRDLIHGQFSRDPCEIVDKFGGRWSTTEFRAGDALIFSMFTMHASIKNTTNQYRISCDTRYQPASDPMDERWVGAKPKAHYASQAPGAKLTSIEEAREKWGV